MGESFSPQDGEDFASHEEFVEGLERIRAVVEAAADSGLSEGSGDPLVDLYAVPLYPSDILEKGDASSSGE